MKRELPDAVRGAIAQARAALARTKPKPAKDLDQLAREAGEHIEAMYQPEGES